VDLRLPATPASSCRPTTIADPVTLAAKPIHPTTIVRPVRAGERRSMRSSSATPGRRAGKGRFERSCWFSSPLDLVYKHLGLCTPIKPDYASFWSIEDQPIALRRLGID
jgi:hypothetical protein